MIFVVLKMVEKTSCDSSFSCFKICSTSQSTITNIQGNGIECYDGSIATLSANRIVGNAGCGVQLNNGSTLNMLDTNVTDGNALGAVNDKRAEVVKEETYPVKS